MEFSQEEYDEAVKDFLDGEGKGMPSVKVCERLMRFNKDINSKILKSINIKLNSISIMPSGNEIIFVDEPKFNGFYTTSMTITKDTHTLTVNFDRN